MRYAASGKHHGPLAIRYPRGCLQAEYAEVPPFTLGVPHVVHTGKEVCIFCAGTTLVTGEEVCKLLKTHHIDATLVNLRTLFPLNEELISQMAQSHCLLVTIEDGALKGGIGESIAATTATREIACKCITKGYPTIVPHGSPKDLEALFHMDALSITNEILDTLNREGEHNE